MSRLDPGMLRMPSLLSGSTSTQIFSTDFYSLVMLQEKECNCDCIFLSTVAAQNNGDIRLVGQDNSGRLEVFLNQGWGTVCYNTPSPGAARAACRQLGYSDYEKVDTVGNMG